MTIDLNRTHHLFCPGTETILESISKNLAFYIFEQPARKPSQKPVLTVGNVQSSTFIAQNSVLFQTWPSHNKFMLISLH